MKLQDLYFSYPVDLIATEPKKDFRILFSQTNNLGADSVKEISKLDFLNQFTKKDVLVINTTKVIKRRVFSEAPNILEILFIKNTQTKDQSQTWEVLFLSKTMQEQETLNLPGGVVLKLIKKTMPQVVTVNKILDINYFQNQGQMPLPPYIQKARKQRKSSPQDNSNYQSDWAKHWGSVAAPTASLHFTKKDLNYLTQTRKAKVLELSLHIGLGTFLPIKTKNLSDHKMHQEEFCIPKETLKGIINAKNKGFKIWALGTTVTRALETWALATQKVAIDLAEKSATQKVAIDLAEKSATQKDFISQSQLFITPGFCFKIVDVLLSNFHQPKSTLLAMLMAFAGQKNILQNYQWAIEKKFRLFSYGDLGVWHKKIDLKPTQKNKTSKTK